MNSPTGMDVTPQQLPNSPYTSDVAANNGVLQYWRSGHWFTMAVKIASAERTGPDNQTTALRWDYGAFQGAEGDAVGEDWYIDHVKEELDAPREFYFEAATQKLWYVHNATMGTPPPSEWTWETPLLPILINISGTKANPVKAVSITGIKFTGAAASFMMPHGIPSGGDWGLARIAAIRIEGAEGVNISNSLFSRLDGNAIFLSGYVYKAYESNDSYESKQ